MYLTGITVTVSSLIIGKLILTLKSKNNEISYLKQENKKVQSLKDKINFDKEEMKRCQNARHKDFTNQLELKGKIEICQSEKSKLQNDYIAKVDESRN